MSRYEFTEGTSRKFWEISLDGASHTVRYGRLGTDGRSQTKTFADAAAAKASADKLTTQKLKKGYVAVGPSIDAETLRSWLRERAMLLAVFHDYEAFFRSDYSFEPWIDDSRAAALSDLGSTGEGSRLAVWHRSPGHECVVYLGSEGGRGVVTANLTDWVAVLALGITFGGYPGATDFVTQELSYKFDDYDEDFMEPEEDPVRAQATFAAEAEARFGPPRGFEAIANDARKLQAEFLEFLSQ